MTFMSLSLDQDTKPNGVEIKTGLGNRVWLGTRPGNFVGDAEIDMSMADFCAAVEYVMTNTNLDAYDDPRLELQKRICALRVITGYDELGARLGPPDSRVKEQIIYVVQHLSGDSWEDFQASTDRRDVEPWTQTVLNSDALRLIERKETVLACGAVRKISHES